MSKYQKYTLISGHLIVDGYKETTFNQLIKTNVGAQIPHIVRFDSDTEGSKACTRFIKVKNVNKPFKNHPEFSSYADKFIALSDKQIISLWIALFFVRYHTKKKISSNDVYVGINGEIFVIPSLNVEVGVDADVDPFILEDGINIDSWKEGVTRSYSLILEYLRILTPNSFMEGDDEFKDFVLKFKHDPLTIVSRKVSFSFEPSIPQMESEVVEANKLELLLQSDQDRQAFASFYDKLSIAKIVEILRAFIIRKVKTLSSSIQLLSSVQNALEERKSLEITYRDYISRRDNTKDIGLLNVEERVLDQLLANSKILGKYKIKFKDFAIGNKKLLAMRISKEESGGEGEEEE